jgi:hypothetical protein
LGILVALNISPFLGFVVGAVFFCNQGQQNHIWHRKEQAAYDKVVAPVDGAASTRIGNGRSLVAADDLQLSPTMLHLVQVLSQQTCLLFFVPRLHAQVVVNLAEYFGFLWTRH